MRINDRLQRTVVAMVLLAGSGLTASAATVEKAAPVARSAVAGLAVPTLARVSAPLQTVKPGGNVTLSATAPAGASVLFRSIDLGAFADGKTNWSATADANCEVSAIWTAAPGTVSFSRILVTSPQASGQLEFLVEVKP